MIKRLTTMALLVFFLSACTGIGVDRPTATPTLPASPPTLTATPTPIPPTVTPSPSETATPTATATVPVVYGPENFPASINPLTGLPVNDPALLERRPLSVKVQIFPRGQRPPWGVSLANIVFDYYQNNGMTRFHAIFYGQDANQVGPIRSGRLFDSHVVTMYKSALAFGGADQRILKVFLSSDFADRLVFEGSHNCPPMCRIDPNGFNFLVADTAELSKYITTKGVSNTRQDLDGMSFDTLPPAGGRPGVQVFVRHSISAYNRWDYDPNSARYLRFQDTIEAGDAQGEVFDAMIDKLTGQQVAADNVVILYLPHAFAYKSKSTPNEIVDIQLMGTGWAYAYRDGQMYEARWNRPNKESVLFLTFPDGSLYPYKPGNTWYEVVGQSSQLTDLGNGGWRYVFSFP